MKKAFILALVALLFTACSKGKSGKLDEIAKATQAAKKSIDFVKIKTECRFLETKEPEVKKDPRYQEVCTLGPLVARAKLAMAEGGDSNNCTFVKMDIEEAIRNNIEADRMKKLLADVKQSCGD